MTTKKNKATNITPKQANVAGGNLLRGLDNSIKDATRHLEKLHETRAKLSTLSAGLSNLAAAVPAKPAAKAPAKPAPAKKAAKPAAKPAPKPAPAKKGAPAKAAKPAPAKPAPAKPAAKAPAKPAKAPASPKPEEKAPVEGRPSIRTAVKDLLRGLPAGTTIHTTEAYSQTVSKWGYWSKQTFYNLVNNDPEISNVDSQLSMATGASKAAPKPKAPKAPKAAKPEPAKAEPKDDRVDSLVRKVEADKATSAVV